MNLKNVICLAVGQNYDCVAKYAVTAHPARAPYPQNPYEYLIPIQKGGIIETLYRVVEIVECLPCDIYSYQSRLSPIHYQQLVQYHESRMETYEYGAVMAPYRFYILRQYGKIRQPFIRKYVRMSLSLDIRDVPLLE